MDKIKNASQLAIIKKLIALGCSLLCALLLFTKMLKYTATTTLIGGSDSITMSGGFSLFNFLFNGDLNVMDTKIKFLREMFSFSHVVMWISFCLCMLSIIVLIAGFFAKKSVISKIGSITLTASVIVVAITSFNRFPSGNTIRYIEFFTIPFVLAIILSFVALFVTFSIADNGCISKK